MRFQSPEKWSEHCILLCRKINQGKRSLDMHKFFLCEILLNTIAINDLKLDYNKFNILIRRFNPY